MIGWCENIDFLYVFHIYESLWLFKDVVFLYLVILDIHISLKSPHWTTHSLTICFGTSDTIIKSFILFVTVLKITLNVKSFKYYHQECENNVNIVSFKHCHQEKNNKKQQQEWYSFFIKKTSLEKQLLILSFLTRKHYLK